MAKAKRLGPSEFEGRGPFRSGVMGSHRSHEKVRIAVRTEQDPEGLVDLDAEPDKWKHGGIESVLDKLG